MKDWQVQALLNKLDELKQSIDRVADLLEYGKQPKDICAECNTQMYSSAHGWICRNSSCSASAA